jgi:hypothetical protein
VKKSRLCRQIRNKQRIPFLPLSVRTCAQHHALSYHLCFCWVSVIRKFFRPHRCFYERSLAFSWILAKEGITTVGRMWEKMSNCMPISFLRPQIRTIAITCRSSCRCQFSVLIKKKNPVKVLFLLNKFPLPASFFFFKKRNLFFDTQTKSVVGYVFNSTFVGHSRQMQEDQ